MIALSVIAFCAAVILTSILASVSKYCRNPLVFVVLVIVFWIGTTVGYFALTIHLWDNAMHSNPQPANVGSWAR